MVEVNRSIGRRLVSPAELFLILKIISEMEYVGRYYLSEKLNMGEATIRNILNTLKQLNIIEAYRGGHRLTSYGKNLINEINSIIEIHVDMETGISGETAVFVVKGFSNKIGSILEFRDEIIRNGGRGAIILEYKDGKLIFPDSGLPIDIWRSDIKEEILEKTTLNEGDIIIIVSSDTQKEAILSGLNTIIKYLYIQ